MMIVYLLVAAAALYAGVAASHPSLACVNAPHKSFVRNPRGCSWYYVCMNGTAHSQECGPGLNFDVRGKCNFPQHVDCGACSPHGLQSIRYPGSCRKYIECNNGNRRVLECSEGLKFDTELGTCNLAHLVECTPTTTPKPEVTEDPTDAPPVSPPSTIQPPHTATAAPPTRPPKPTPSVNPPTHKPPTVKPPIVTVTAWPATNGTQPTAQPPTRPPRPTGSSTIPTNPPTGTWTPTVGPTRPPNSTHWPTVTPSPTWSTTGRPTRPTTVKTSPHPTRPSSTTHWPSNTPTPTVGPTRPPTHWPTVGPTKPPTRPTVGPTKPPTHWPTVTPTPTVGPTQTPKPDCPTKPSPCHGVTNIYLAHESDCERYYFCFFTVTVTRTCPSGLHWNQLVNDCDLPQNAHCIHRIGRRPLTIAQVFGAEIGAKNFGIIETDKN